MTLYFVLCGPSSDYVLLHTRSEFHFLTETLLHTLRSKGVSVLPGRGNYIFPLFQSSDILHFLMSLLKAFFFA